MEEHGFGMESPRLTATLAGLVGIGYLLVAVSHFLMPAEQLHFASGVDAEFFRSLAAEPGMFKLHYWAMALAATGATGVVVSLGTELPAWFRWVRVLALVGFVVTAVSFMEMQFQALHLVRAFGGLESGARDAVVSSGIGNLDPSGFFSFGLVGLWLIALNVLASARSAWNPAMAILGTMGGVLVIGAFLGTVLQVPLLVDVAAGVGAGVVIPIWFLMLAWQVGGSRRASVTAKAARAETAPR